MTARRLGWMMLPYAFLYPGRMMLLASALFYFWCACYRDPPRPPPAPKSKPESKRIPT